MNPPISRRNFFTLAGGAALMVPIARRLAAQDASIAPSAPAPADQGITGSFAPESGNPSYRSAVTPNGAPLPWKVVDGVKVFHLVAEPVNHEFAPGLVAECWGYNGRVHGPTIEAQEGDRVRIYVSNRLPEATTVHWHGMLVPNGMDGVGGLNQKTIGSGETFKYEFVLSKPGTYMYHPHHDEGTQMQLGMMGMFVVHPRRSVKPAPDRDYVIQLSEWRIDVGARRPDPNEMTDFNIFTMNGRSFPGTQPIVAQRGERVRIRIGNLSPMSHHSIHLHGYHFHVVATDGGEIPEAGRWPETTVLVPTGSTRTIEFVADAPGDWAMHCHMLHHGMNQMGHTFGNLIGVNAKGLGKEIGSLVPGYMAMGSAGMGDMGQMGMMMGVPANSIPMVGAEGPNGYITMGGMFTILKVREALEGQGDPGWYRPPSGTQAEAASGDELKRDGIATTLN